MVFGLFVLLTTLSVCCIRKRIKFTAAHLKVAGKAIFRLPGRASGVRDDQRTDRVGHLVGAGETSLPCSTRTTSSYVCETWNEHVRDGQLRPQVQDRRDYRRAIRHAAHLLQGLVFRNIIGVTTAGIVTAWKTVDNTSLVTVRAWLRV